MLIVDLLSHHSCNGSSLNNRNSTNRFFNHVISQSPTAMALYSASAVDRATTSCFLLRQDTGFPPTNIQYPEVDLLSSTQLAQSASQYPSILRCPFLPYQSPFPGLPFRYRMILIAASICWVLGSCIYLLTRLTA